MQAIILAAGKGSRLRPLSDRFSKGMVPLLGRPFMAWLMADLLAAGVSSFVIVHRPDDEACRDYFSSTEPYRGCVEFASQDQPLGSADALRRALPFVKGDVVISACDNLVDPSELAAFMERWRRRTGELGLLGLMKQRRELLSRSGVVVWDGQRISRIVEKPALAEAPSDIISLPLYCLEHSFVAAMADLPLSVRGEYEIQVPIRRLMAREPGVYGHLFRRRFTLTAIEDLLPVCQQLLNRQGWGSFVDPDAVVGPGAVIGAGVSVEAGATVGANAVLENVVVAPGARVPAGATIREQVIL